MKYSYSTETTSPDVSDGLPAPQIRRARLQDVADAAGVSVSTVSSVLNGACLNTRTSEATRERIRQAADQLQYRPNDIARSLRNHVAHTIGFYNGYGYIDVRNPFIYNLISGMHQHCDSHGYSLLIHRSGRLEQGPAPMQEIIGGKVDGVVVYSSPDDGLVAKIADRHFPAVALASASPRIPSVTADDAGGMRIIAQRFAHRGHKRVLYRMPPYERVSANRRYRAFRETADELGIEVLVGEASDYMGTLSAAEMALIHAGDDVRPTAIACWNDSTSVAAYSYLAYERLTDRIELIGFDGFDHPRLPVTITSIFVPWDEIARTAVDAVFRIMAGQSVPQEIAVPVTLIEGDTG
ncbi:MAG: LacI family DNA-binding transcriptional regulator [Capsulimonadaceae bacterium]